MSRPVAIFAGYLARYPLGGHLLSQYHFLAGLAKLGYEVVFLEHYGWEKACYDPRTNTMSDDPTTGSAKYCHSSSASASSAGLTWTPRENGMDCNKTR